MQYNIPNSEGWAITITWKISKKWSNLVGVVFPQYLSQWFNDLFLILHSWRAFNNSMLVNTTMSWSFSSLRSYFFLLNNCGWRNQKEMTEIVHMFNQLQNQRKNLCYFVFLWPAASSMTTMSWFAAGTLDNGHMYLQGNILRYKINQSFHLLWICWTHHLLVWGTGCLTSWTSRLRSRCRDGSDEKVQGVEEEKERMK